jgi:hypothetical protein
MKFDLRTEEGRRQCREFLVSVCPELRRYLGVPVTKEETQTDPLKGSVQGKKEMEQRHRQHLARVKELERDNQRRNADR